MLKRCNKCGGKKPITQFKKNWRSSNGCSSICKECHRKYMRQYSKTDIGLIVRRKAGLKYSRTKKGKVAHRKANRKYMLKYSKVGRGKQIVKAIRKNHNFLKKTQGIGVTNQQWDVVLRRYNYRCAYCGVKGNMTVDHVIPISKGGKHSPDNIVPACIECNIRKGIKMDWKPKEFRKEG